MYLDTSSFVSKIVCIHFDLLYIVDMTVNLGTYSWETIIKRQGIKLKINIWVCQHQNVRNSPAVLHRGIVVLQGGVCIVYCFLIYLFLFLPTSPLMGCLEYEKQKAEVSALTSGKNCKNQSIW